MPDKKISVITINLNNAAGLEKTIQSVITQDYNDVEFIIIDGGSEDGSKIIIETFSNKIHKSISEKDTGIYSAMNKGLVMATGEYVLFLNSGDSFFNNNVLQNLIKDGCDAEIVYGNLMIVDGKTSVERIYPAKLSFSYFLIGSLPHPATLIKKSVFNKVGFFADDLKIVADWAFFLLAIAKYNCSYRHVCLIVTNFDLEGISSQEKNLKLIKTERSTFLLKNFPLFLDDYALFELTDQSLRDLQKQLGYRLYNKLRTLVVKK